VLIAFEALTALNQSKMQEQKLPVLELQFAVFAFAHAGENRRPGAFSLHRAAGHCMKKQLP